jgi:predicted dehydrogenase
MIMIGAGRIASVSHLPAVLACVGVDLVAIVDSMPGRAAKLAREHGLLVQTFSDLEPALERADGAIVATPSDTHCDIATRCLMRGIHVLIEKPMTSTYAEALKLSELARNTGLKAMVGYVTRHLCNGRLMKTLLDQKHFGRVRHFAYQFGTNGGWAPLAGYRLDGSGRGVGVLAISASHFLDRMLWFWGYPIKMTYLDDGANGPEANCVAQFQFEGGMYGTLRCSKTADLPGGLVLDTEMGRVVLPEGEDAEIVLLPHNNEHLQYVLTTRGQDPSLERDPFLAQISDFVSACKTGECFGCDFNQGAESMRLMEDLYSRRQLLMRDWYSSIDSGEPR